ncbi:MAG: sensor histidine kinase [Lachnospiraceae bacterium]
MIVGFYALLELTSIIICLFYLYNKPFRLDIKTIVCLILDAFYIYILYKYDMPDVYTMVFYVIIFLYVGMEFGFYIKKIIVNFLLAMLIISIIQFGITIFYSIFFREKTIVPCTYLIVNILVCLIVVFLRKCGIHRISRFLLEKELAGFFSVFYMGIILICYMMKYKVLEGMQVEKYVFPIFSAGYMCLITAYFIKYKMTSRQKEAEIRIHKMYIQSYDNLITEIRSKQHDFDDHLNTILSQHYVCKSYDELVASQQMYIGELKNSNKYNKLLSNGNSAVVGFLYSKFLECDEKGIDVEYNLNFDQLSVDIPISKIIELIGNIFDNAMEAVMRCGERKIYIYVAETENNVKIEVRNRGKAIPYTEFPQLFIKGYSKKGSGHGFGLYNVKKICEQYHIDISCMNKEYEGDNWIVVMLNINKPMLLV